MMLCISQLLPSTPLSFAVLFIIFFLLSSPSESLNFKILRFDSDTTDIYYEGDAQPLNGEIRLNRVDYMDRSVRAAHIKHIRIWNPANQDLTDFTTNFSFIIDTVNQTTGLYGHGLAFFLAPVEFEIPLNSAGGFLGLFNTTSLLNSTNNHIVAIEFGSFANAEWDPPNEHLAIIVNSLSSKKYVNWNASLHSLDVGRASITYKANTEKLSVYLAYDHYPTPYNFSYDLDLRKILPEWVKIGFTASTGMNVAKHNVQSWEFSSTLEGEERGDAAKNKEVQRRNKLAVGLVVPLVVVLAAAVIACMILKRSGKKKQGEEAHLISMDCILDRASWPKKFSYTEMVLATANFSDDKKLEQGGFGRVYKGYLSDLDLPVAVKKISSGSKQGKRECAAEVQIISQLRHRNLVQLIGCCHDKDEFLLVYELMPNGSLDKHLFSTEGTLTWSIRYKIAIGLASAVLYLHEEWEQCVIHRDIKSSNVMLDAGFNARLGDFGLALLMDHELDLRTTALAGTLGYLAPEYISSGRASKKSDVYSFGVVALEIACGRKSVEHKEEESRIRLVQWVWDLYANGRLLDAADKRLSLDLDMKEMECLMMVGLWCAHPNPNIRPSIKQAIQVLQLEAAMPDLLKKMPVAVFTAASSPAHSNQPSITTSIIALGR